MTYPFTAIYKKDEGWFVGYVEELPGANTQGRTLDEARKNLTEAVRLILEANKTLCMEGLKGFEYVREPLSVDLA